MRTDTALIMLNWLAAEMPLLPRLAIANHWLFQPLLLRLFGSKPSTRASVQTVMTPTMVQGSEKGNVIPTMAKVVFNVRTLLGDSTEEVLEYMKEVIDGKSDGCGCGCSCGCG